MLNCFQTVQNMGLNAYLVESIISSVLLDWHDSSANHQHLTSLSLLLTRGYVIPIKIHPLNCVPECILLIGTESWSIVCDFPYYRFFQMFSYTHSDLYFANPLYMPVSPKIPTRPMWLQITYVRFPQLFVKHFQNQIDYHFNERIPSSPNYSISCIDLRTLVRYLALFRQSI